MDRRGERCGRRARRASPWVGRSPRGLLAGDARYSCRYRARALPDCIRRNNRSRTERPAGSVAPADDVSTTRQSAHEPESGGELHECASTGDYRRNCEALPFDTAAELPHPTRTPADYPAVYCMRAGPVKDRFANDVADRCGKHQRDRLRPIHRIRDRSAKPERGATPRRQRLSPAGSTTAGRDGARMARGSAA